MTETRGNRPRQGKVHRCSAIVAVAVAGSSLLTAGTAAADVKRFTDPPGNANADIRWVRVDNSTLNPNKVIVSVDLAQMQDGSQLEILFDTKRGDAGPEYRASGAWGSEWLLRRTDNWVSWGTPVECPGGRWRGDESTGRNRLVLPRSCLGFPGKVRVSVHATMTTSSGTVQDWAPAPRRFSAWVAR